jgi:hypothetical protein
VGEKPEEPARIESSAGTHQVISGPTGRMPHTCCDDLAECWSLPLAKTPRAAAQASVTSGVLNLTRMHLNGRLKRIGPMVFRQRPWVPLTEENSIIGAVRLTGQGDGGDTVSAFG